MSVKNEFKNRGEIKQDSSVYYIRRLTQSGIESLTAVALGITGDFGKYGAESSGPTSPKTAASMPFGGLIELIGGI